jgi:hypothetical protein
MLIHLIGSPCSGKTSIIKELKKNNSNIRSWDILEDFYLPLKIVTDIGFDGDLYSIYSPSISVILEIEVNKAKQNKNIFILESSGWNKSINKFIKTSGEEFIPFILKVPSEQETRLRAIAQSKSAEQVLQIRNLFLQKLPILLDSLSNKYKDNDLIPKEPVSLDLAKERINQLFIKE